MHHRRVLVSGHAFGHGGIDFSWNVHVYQAGREGETDRRACAELDRSSPEPPFCPFPKANETRGIAPVEYADCAMFVPREPIAQAL
jgi:hypothetical protein